MDAPGRWAIDLANHGATPQDSSSLLAAYASCVAGQRVSGKPHAGERNVGVRWRPTFISVEAVAMRLGSPGLNDMAQVAASCAESLNRAAEPGPDLAS